MLNISLDDEAERYLIEILKREEITINDLIKQLLRNRLNIAHPQKTILERMGGMPQHLLYIGGLSDRDKRREIISARLQARHQASS
ncbi:MAG: hypothetical protein MJA27_07845 [Pseudanabaenales cyanobacterium]|nr:hypothetical protein [Pseudanabaenales cyanobacterium]